MCETFGGRDEFRYWLFIIGRLRNGKITSQPCCQAYANIFRRFAKQGNLFATKFWKNLCSQGQEKGRLCYLGRFCLIQGLHRRSVFYMSRNAYHKIWEWTFKGICHSIRSCAEAHLYQSQIDDSIRIGQRQLFASGGRPTYRSCNGWSLLSNCTSTDWDEDAWSRSWRVCLCERSRRAKDNYIQFGNMYLLFIWILGSLCSVNASRSMSRPMGRDRNLGPLPGPVYWLLVWRIVVHTTKRHLEY